MFYQFKADEYCGGCIVSVVCTSRGIEGHGLSHITEEALDLMARFEGINRKDEYSFDSGDFPKTVYEWEEDEVTRNCGSCGGLLV